MSFPVEFAKVIGRRFLDGLLCRNFPVGPDHPDELVRRSIHPRRKPGDRSSVFNPLQPLFDEAWRNHEAKEAAKRRGK